MGRRYELTNTRVNVHLYLKKRKTKECHQNGIGGAHQWNRKGITQRGDSAETGLLPVPIEGDQRLRRQKPRVQEGKGAGVGARGRRGGGGGRGGRGRRGDVVAVVGESKGRKRSR